MDHCPSGECLHNSVRSGAYPLEDGVAIMFELKALITGPKFGCIHHEPK